MVLGANVWPIQGFEGLGGLERVEWECKVLLLFPFCT